MTHEEITIYIPTYRTEWVDASVIDRDGETWSWHYTRKSTGEVFEKSGFKSIGAAKGSLTKFVRINLRDNPTKYTREVIS